MHIVQKIKATKRILQQDMRKRYSECGNISYVNWWNENPEEAWFTRFIRSNFPDVNEQIRFYSVFGPEFKIEENFSGKKIFFSGENVECRRDYPNMQINESADYYLNYRVKKYGNYGIPKMDLSLGFGNLNNQNYYRLPLWMVFNFDPKISYKDICDKVEMINSSRPLPLAHNSVVISSHDDWGTRTAICKDIQDIMHITYAGKWRNNTSELKEKFNDDKNIFMKHFKFNICAENVDADGYCTEKIFDSFKAGTVPIYHGDLNNPEPDIINKDAVIFWNYDTDNEDNIKIVRRLNSDDAFYDKFVNQSKLKDNAAEEIYDRMNALKKKFAEVLEI